MTLFNALFSTGTSEDDFFFPFLRPLSSSPMETEGAQVP